MLLKSVLFGIVIISLCLSETQYEHYLKNCINDPRITTTREMYENFDLRNDTTANRTIGCLLKCLMEKLHWMDYKSRLNFTAIESTLKTKCASDGLEMATQIMSQPHHPIPCVKAWIFVKMVTMVHGACENWRTIFSEALSEPYVPDPRKHNKNETRTDITNKTSTSTNTTTNTNPRMFNNNVTETNNTNINTNN